MVKGICSDSPVLNGATVAAATDCTPGSLCSRSRTRSNVSAGAGLISNETRPAIDAGALECLPRRQAEVERQQVGGVGAELVLDHSHEAVDQQPRAYQQDHRERHLAADEQRCACAGVRGCRWTSGPTRAMPRPVSTREACIAGTSANSAAVTTTTAAVKREHADDPATTSSERGKSAGAASMNAFNPAHASAVPMAAPSSANGRHSVSTWRTTRHLPAPSVIRRASSARRAGAAGEQQPCDVGARDQQDQRHGALKDRQRRGVIAGGLPGGVQRARSGSRQRLDPHAKPLVPMRIGDGQPGRERLELGLCLGDGHAGLQPADEAVAAGSPLDLRARQA